MTRIKNDEPRTYYFYKLVCNDTTVKDFYIGSTANWRDRKAKHKSACCNPKHKEYNGDKYKTIRSNSGWENWSMLEIEQGIYTKREAEAHEYDLMAQLKSTLNKYKCFGAHSKCEHGIRKEGCKTCKGSKICEHDKQKQYCKTCKGSMICEHDKEKQYCKTCKGSSTCEHDYGDKRNCPFCSPYLCECGSWTTKGKMNRHFRSTHCKAFHMTTYGQVFI
jgi:hypothetical protein